MSDLIVDRADGVLRLTINRPDRLNALTAGLIDEMTAHVVAAAADGSRAIVISGMGRAFSSGADVGPDGAPPGLDTLDAANALALAITASPLIVIAAVNGVAAGVGCSIALACDLAVAKESASFMLAFTKIGLMPDGGASLLVPASVGRARAMRMALLAEKISATTAGDWGLVSHVVPDDAFEETVATIVGQVANGAPMALAATKRAVNDLSIEMLEQALQRERDGQGPLLQSADFAEGMAAFQEKRAANFTGS